ncbi:MAG: D-glycero-beta-D-manno-heptose 1-phosphate adenylyltransferase [Candidatus Omnitrophica bacterium]|nr:D-glycero-beta-D-manno-heptose 1-phosphate adenylyltransferase [Candidatus Omnitrophota bacterium]
MNTHVKIVKIPTLKKKIRALRRKNLKVAFTNGCFDILHLGHVRYLKEAKRTADVLVVGLNSDRSIRKIKGPKRPIVDERSRAEVLAALTCVDYVVLFHDQTPLKLIEAVKPDVLIKGADWKGKGAVGSECVRSYGGRVKFIKYVKGCSSTGIINRILKSA